MAKSRLASLNAQIKKLEKTAAQKKAVKAATDKVASLKKSIGKL